MTRAAILRTVAPDDTGRAVALPRDCRRVSQVVGRVADRSRPFIVSVVGLNDLPLPTNDNGVSRRDWRHRYLGRNEVVVITYLPMGGGGGGGRGGGAGKQIGMAVAAIALMVVAPYVAGPLVGALGLTGLAATVATNVITAGIVIGANALVGLASRSKAKKENSDNRPMYGIAGGGNLPRPGDRIPVGYGRCWTRPDLSQPDYSYYEGEDQILIKRMTLGLGRYQIHKIRAGTQLVWDEINGVAPLFAGSQVEFLFGTASAIAPGDVLSIPAVAGAPLPRPSDPGAPFAGPFVINATGPLITAIQVDLAFPQGIFQNVTNSRGSFVGQAGWGYDVQYSPLNAQGQPSGSWATLVYRTYDTEGFRRSQRAIRETNFVPLPAGRYAVRAQNIMPEQNNVTNALTWDGLRGWTPDTRIRPGITEIAMKLRSSQALQAAALAEIEVECTRILPVWDGVSQWVEMPTRKAVWAAVDILRNAEYGGAVPDSQIDVGRFKAYADALSQFDTFDAFIRGPVSVWEAASTALLPMRAEPVHIGRAWSIVRDEPQAARRHLITRRQIVEGSTQLDYDLDLEDGAADVYVEYDRDGDFRTPSEVRHVIGQASLTPTRKRLTGVTSFEHALHLARWQSAVGAYRRAHASVTTEHDARIYKRGDRIAVDEWFMDRAKFAGVVARSGDTLTLDADVTVVANDVITLRDRTGREWGPVVLAGNGASPRIVLLDPASRAARETATGLTLGQVLAQGAEPSTVAVIGALNGSTGSYLVRQIQPQGRDRITVKVVTDDPRVWDVVGETMPGPPPAGQPPLTDSLTPTIQRLSAQAVQKTSSIACEWSLLPPAGAVSYEVDMSYDGWVASFPIYRGTATSGQVDEIVARDDLTIGVRARAIGRTGLAGTWIYTTFTSRAASINADLNVTHDDMVAGIGYRGRMFDQIERLISANNEFGIAAWNAERLGRTGIKEAQRVEREAARQLAQKTTELRAALDLSDAGIRTDLLAVSTKADATAVTVTSLGARVANNEAGLASETVARATAVSALAQQLDTFTATVNGSIATLTAGQQALATSDAAIVQMVNGVAATANDISASGQMRFQAVSAPAGINSRFSVTLKTFGAGFDQESGLYFEQFVTPQGNVRSQVFMNADSFAVGDALSRTVPFQVVAGTTYIAKAMIGEAWVGTQKLEPDAATINAYQGLPDGAGFLPTTSNGAFAGLIFITITLDSFEVLQVDWGVDLQYFTLPLASQQVTLGAGLLVNGIATPTYRLGSPLSFPWGFSSTSSRFRFVNREILGPGPGTHSLVLGIAHGAPNSGPSIAYYFPYINVFARKR